MTLKPGESRKVSFTVDRSDFGFYDNDGEFVVEPGTIELYVGRLLAGDAEEDLPGHQVDVTRSPLGSSSQ